MKKITEKIEKRIIALYTTKTASGTWIGANNIAKIVGVSKTSVQNVLNRNGIKLRSPKEAHAHGKRCKPIKNLPPKNEKPPLCKCGCGEHVEWNRRKNKWNVYVSGHYRPYKPYYNRDWLIKEYITNKRTMDDLAKEVNASSRTIKRYLKKFNIKVRSQGESLSLSGAVSKENNPAWKGGVADWDYSDDWKRIAKSIRDRDKWTCQHCGEQRKRWGVNLHVHHIDGNKLNNNPNNLISLCAKCHRRVHSGDISL